MKIILKYTLIAGVIAALTFAIPGTSLILTGLEIFMLVELAKANGHPLSLKDIGLIAVGIYTVSTLLKDLAMELIRVVPLSGVVVAVLFVFFLGLLANVYFSKQSSPPSNGPD